MNGIRLLDAKEMNGKGVEAQTLHTPVPRCLSIDGGRVVIIGYAISA